MDLITNERCNFRDTAGKHAISFLIHAAWNSLEKKIDQSVGISSLKWSLNVGLTACLKENVFINFAPKMSSSWSADFPLGNM